MSAFANFRRKAAVPLPARERLGRFAHKLLVGKAPQSQSFTATKEYPESGHSPATIPKAAVRRAVLGEKGTPAAQLGLLDSPVTDDAIVDAMIEYPILVNRPIVVTSKGTQLCRPLEAALDLADRRPAGFTKEDGEILGL